MQIRSNITGLSQVLKGLKVAEEDIHNALQETMQDTMNIAKATVKLNAPVGERGYLKEQIFSKVENGEHKIIGQVYGNAEYNPYVEFGTGMKGSGTYPYKIKGYTLRYKADKWRVKIPNVGYRWIQGQIAQPHFGEGYKNIDKNFIEILKQKTQKYR